MEAVLCCGGGAKTPTARQTCRQADRQTGTHRQKGTHRHTQTQTDAQRHARATTKHRQADSYSNNIERELQVPLTHARRARTVDRDYSQHSHRKLKTDKRRMGKTPKIRFI